MQSTQALSYVGCCLNAVPRLHFILQITAKTLTVIDELLSIGVEVIEQPDKLIPIIEAADCAIEDGAKISKIIDEYSLKVRKDFYSVEQTSGGVRYFEGHNPAYPIINDAMSPVKLHIENKLATPEGVLQCFSRATGNLLSGKNILIIGYGSIEEGLAWLAPLPDQSDNRIPISAIQVTLQLQRLFN